jgi:uncharacterized protein YbcI
MEPMVQEVTGVKVLSLHHDISTVTGEEIVLFTLAGSPLFRETKKKQDLRLIRRPRLAGGAGSRANPP